MSDAGEAISDVLKDRPSWLARTVPTGVGAVCIAAWLGLVGSLFAGVGLDEESGLFVTAVLLAMTALSAAVAWLSRSRARIVATVAALLYAAVFAYLRFGFDRMMPDAILYLLTAVFYLSPLVAGISTVVAGRRSAS